jgi:UTP--glucose-1-phosphate uridylyltransferase
MKAVIPAAGFGTRFLPASKTVPKEMLPIGSKPAIQIIAEEAIEAGAEEIVIVTSPGKPSLKKHFDVDEVWRNRLAKKPEIDEEMHKLEEIGKRISWVLQTEQKGLGHAVLQAHPLLADETSPVLILLGDALVSGKVPASVDMAKISAAHSNASVVGLEKVPRAKVSRYGIAGGKALDERIYLLDDLVEKPEAEKAPSDLAVAGRYLLSPEIFELLASQTPGHGGEIQLTDSIRRLLATSPVYGFVYPGRRHDIGNPRGYFETLQAYNAF